MAQQAAAKATATRSIAELPPEQRAEALDAESSQLLCEELEEFRLLLRQEARAAKPEGVGKPRQTD